MTIHRGADALARDLLYIIQTATVGEQFPDVSHAAVAAQRGILERGVVERRAKGAGNGMRAVLLGVGGEMQQVVGVYGLWMHGIYREDALRQRAGLVEYHGGEPRESVHVVAALDEDSLARGSANAAEEAQRHGDDESARTAHHEEAQGTIDPRGKALPITVAEERRHESHGDGEKHHYRGIDTGEAADEGLATRLVLGRLLHELYYL